MYKRLILLLAASFMLMIGGKAMAIGIGAYVDVGGGGHTYDVTTSDFTKPGDAKFVNVMGGFILDTNTGGPGIFNYRLKLGGGSYVNYEREMDLDISKIDMEHTFGFGIVRKQMIRFWIGPSIGVNYQWGKSDSSRRYVGTGGMIHSPYREIFLLWPSFSHQFPMIQYMRSHLVYTGIKLKKYILQGAASASLLD